MSIKLRISLLLLVAVLYTLPTNAQEWELINPLPTPEYLFSVHYLNQDTGFVAGQYCTLLRTTDGGESWVETDTLSYGIYRDIFFLNNDTGFVVGGKSILRTNNCGESWITMGPHLTAGYNDIFFLNDTYGWVVGDYNTVMRTVDGGNSWEVLSHSIGTPTFYSNVMFTSPDTGYICGKYGSVFSDAILKKTCDGGESWQEIPVPGNDSNIPDMHVSGGNEVYISLYNNLYHTIDNGQTWDTIPIGYPCSTIKTIEFLDEQNWKVLDGSKLYYSSNAGISWDLHQTYPFSNSMTDMTWIDTSHVILVGQGGMILSSENAGQTFNEVSKGFRYYLKDISFMNFTTGLMVGFDVNRAIIMRTTDGGYNWTNIALDSILQENSLRGVVLNESGTGWASGWGGLMKTVDDGQSWEQIETAYDYSLNKVETWGDKYIWTGGNNGKLLRSANYGESWEDISLPFEDFIDIISFCDSSNGYITVREGQNSGYTKLYKTNDGGNSWQELLHPGGICAIYSISNPDNNTIYLGVNQHGLIKSLDGGASWIYIGAINGVIPRYVHFADPESGIVSMNDYFVAHTWDGGDSWIIDLDNSNYPHAMWVSEVFFHDVQNAILIGNNGLVMKYYNPFVNVLEKPTNDFTDNKPLIYPNPATSIINIKSKDVIYQARIFSVEGKEQFSVSSQDIKAIHTGNLLNGIYLIEMISDNKSYWMKFIIKQ